MFVVNHLILIQNEELYIVNNKHKHNRIILDLLNTLEQGMVHKIQI